MYGTKDFPEYHTSNDNLEFMNKESLKESFEKYIEIIKDLDRNFSQKHRMQSGQKEIKNCESEMYLNLFPKCEPQLGRRGVYRKLGGQNNSLESRKNEFAIFWVLNLSDGQHSILDIIRKSGFEENVIRNAVKILIEKGILEKIL